MNKTDIKQIIFEEIKSALDEMEVDTAEKIAADTLIDDYEGDIDDEDIEALDLSEAKEALVYKLKSNYTYEEVLRFMQRVNVLLKTYKAPRQKRSKKRFTEADLKKVAAAITSSTGFTSKDIRLAVDTYNSPAQANKFIKALEMKGYIELITQLKKSMVPDRDPNAPETRGRKRQDTEFDMTDDPMADLERMGLSGDIDTGEIGALEENNNTMTNLEKYIKQQIKEAKNPLAKKMKEIENQGRVAALETKLAAVAEMIEETEGRLTRIDEDNEFRDMMDKNAVKEVRKQLKELEKAKGKLEKERAKIEGKVEKKKEVVDEDLPVAEDAVEEDAIDAAIDEVELEEDNFALNESTLRFQKLAGLITESDIKKKLSLNENQMENLAKLLRDEADQPDNKVGKSIFLKYAAQAKKTDVKDIKSLLRKLEDELIDKHPDTFSGDDDIVGSFLSTSKK